MRYPASARILAFVGAAAVLFLPLLPAQVHGVPASVSSFGFGGHFSSAPGVPASVTSLGPNGFTRGPVLFGGGCCFGGFRNPTHTRVFMGRHHGRHGAFFPFTPVYNLPYTPVYVVPEEEAAYDSEDYQGGPTIFDRRGSVGKHVRERIIEDEPERAPAAPAAALAPPQPVAPQPNTLLVYRDGHQSEVQNYAIVGDTLFNLAEGRSFKILLADLDLTATLKANADRGVDFQLPPGAAR